MDNDFEVIKDPKLEEYKDATLQMAYAFDEMVKTKGWGYIKAYIDSSIKVFSNKAIQKGFASMDEYAMERGIVKGQTQILGQIESALKVLAEHMENERRKSIPAA